ncbi:MAG: hypothetical protein GY719_20085 [bacterium]|nr:hypothetical protein [bacterium]
MIAPPPSDEVLLDIAAYVADHEKNEKGIYDPRVKANHAHWKLYSVEDGYYRKMSRRQWIERYVRIRDKDANIVPLILNTAQRRLLALVLKLERAGVPIRVIILKARQMGFSTLVQAMFYERVLRKSNMRALIVAHRKETSQLLLKMAGTMLREHKQDNGKEWNFKLDSKRQSKLRWTAPYHCELEVTSAEVAEPGHGDTCQMVHMSETSRWSDALTKIKGIMQVIPKRPGTMCFNESTANGDEGYFRDSFWEAWNQRHKTIRAANRTTIWVSLFFPWFHQYEYRWSLTTGYGMDLPQDMVDEVMSTLDEEEEWLLKQTYFVRKRGVVKVDVDQLIWRRLCIQDECKGDIGVFNEQYPARPEQAFIASGSPAYNAQRISNLMEAARNSEPLFRADIVIRRRVG